jgi:predicted RNA-binding Zn ribbon-like protein
MLEIDAFEWTPHRFSGGLLVLDVCNSVILRHDPTRRKDRFAVPPQCDAFAEAARRHCAEADLAAQCCPAGSVDRLIALREAADRHFRACASGANSNALLAGLLETAASALRAEASALECTTALSALRLAGRDDHDRLKACPACGWLFFDRSKNRSRAWCDMAVCGNRVKARRFHAARRSAS